MLAELLSRRGKRIFTFNWPSLSIFTILFHSVMSNKIWCYDKLSLAPNNQVRGVSLFALFFRQNIYIYILTFTKNSRFLLHRQLLLNLKSLQWQKYFRNNKNLNLDIFIFLKKLLDLLYYKIFFLSHVIFFWWKS